MGNSIRYDHQGIEYRMGDDLAFNMDPSFLEVMNRAFWTANQLLAEAPDIDDYGYEDQLAKLQDAYDVYWKLYGAFSYLRDDLRDADEGFHKSVNHTADSLENLSLKDISIWREHYEDYSNGCGREEITLLDYVDTISSPDIMYLNVFQMIMWDTVPDDIEAVTIEEYLLNLEEEASFDMDYYCPEQQGLKDTLDLLGMGIKPMYDAISGYDIITGEQLSSKERRKAGGRAALEIALTLAGPLGVYDAIFSKVGAVSTKIWGKLGPKIAPKVDDIIRTIGESGAGRKISSLADDIARIIEDNLDDFAWMGKETERYTYNTGEELLEITAGRYGSVAENAGREVQILNDVDAIHVDSIDVDDIVGEQYEEIFEWQREVNEEYESFLEDLITYDEVPDVEPIYDVGEARNGTNRYITQLGEMSEEDAIRYDGYWKYQEALGRGDFKNGSIYDGWYKPDGTMNYPDNWGAVPGTEEIVILGNNNVTEVGRYGIPTDKSTYVTEVGVSPDRLSLPPNTDPNNYIIYKINGYIDNVERSIVAPWVGDKGLGIQYNLPRPIQWYIEQGILIPEWK